MKRMKHLVAVLLAVSLLFALSGCYVISAQRMYRVKGTYVLSQYTVTPKHERDGTTPTTYNYIEDSEYQYKDYLIVTGEGEGYYVHKQKDSAPTVQRVTLSYEYEEDTGKITYVSYGEADGRSPHTGMKLGVTKKALNYSKIAIDYTELGTKRPMRTEGMSVSFKRVDRATDLSYVEEELGVSLSAE